MYEGLDQIKGWWLPTEETQFRKILDRDTQDEDPKVLRHRFEELWDRILKDTCHETAIDVGAHIGTWTVRMSEHYETTHAFEPDPRSFKALVANTFGLPGVHLQSVGLSDGYKPASAQVGNLGETAMGGTWMAPDEKGDRTLFSLDSLNLDSLNLDSLDFIKIDVEGAEINVLEGAKDTLLRFKPVVCVEVKKKFSSRFNGTPERVYAALQHAGASFRFQIGSDHIFSWR